MKDAGATGARTALVLGRRDQHSSERDRQARRSGHKTQLYLADASIGGPASAGAGAVFAPLHITALVAGRRKHPSRHTPNEANRNWRGRGSWGPRGSRCSGFWLSRLRREGGRTNWPVRAEARLTLPQAPVCQLFSTVVSRAESWQSGALRLGRGGTRCPHFWPGVCSAWPWLEGLQGKPLGQARSTEGQR